MLALEETRLTLNWFKVFSILNMVPIGVDGKHGKIQKQSSKIRVLIWKMLCSVGVSHWFYMLARLVQSLILEPEKYFRWDHFVLHFTLTTFYAVYLFTGFRLFVKTPAEFFIIFNQLFVEREDPVQKMIDRQLEMSAKSKSGNKTENQGNEKRVKSGTGFEPSPARAPHEEIQMEVIGQSKTDCYLEIPPRPLLTWPPQYSLDELVGKLVPSVGVPSGFFMVLILAIDPSRPQLLYSFFPPKWQNVWSFVLLLSVETLSFAIVNFTCMFALVTQVMFFSKVQLELKRKSLQLRNLEEKFQKPKFGIGGREIRKENWILRQILKELRELVVFVELFNRCFSFCIFPWKLYSLSISILYYFFVIRHSEDFPFLAVFLGYLAIALTITYTVMYVNAFSIPGKMEELKNEFMLTAQKTTSVFASTANFNADVSKPSLAKMKREIKGIRSVGVKVGSFYQMERESIPHFVDFVLRNVVTLLVTFPR